VSPASEPFRIEPLSIANAEAWKALFADCGCPCFCRYWHFEGSRHEWLARCSADESRNLQDQLALVQARAPEGRGLLAMRDGSALGWMKLAPRAILQKLREQGPYRSLDLGDDAGVWSIGCFLVRPHERRRGIARALISAAEPWGRAWGARALEAYPHRIAHALHDEEAWMGPEALFLRAKWVAVYDVAPYPVYRKLLNAN
jgi:GNAT superfamily N-acetyltransferase